MQQVQRVGCYACGADDGALWAEENGFFLQKCRGCGALYVSPRPTEASITAAHQTGEHRTRDGVLSVTTPFSPGAVRNNAKHLARLFEPSQGQSPLVPRSWLDVGAGNGETLLAAQAVFGSQLLLRGVEPNRTKRAQALERGVTLHEQLDAALDRRFEVISLINVFSHLPDPRAFIAKLAASLEDDGAFVIATGNAADLEERSQYPDALDLPDHLCFTGAALLESFMGRLGFRTRKLRALRHDTASRTLRNAVRRLGGRPAPLALPYQSPFRSLWGLFTRLQ